jgi:hypothetical protein
MIRDDLGYQLTVKHLDAESSSAGLNKDVSFIPNLMRYFIIIIERG